MPPWHVAASHHCSAEPAVRHPPETALSIDQQDVVDFEVHDPKADEVLLAMVEGRSWGSRGDLLPDLQAKFSAYLAYALDGQLQRDYPQMAGKPIRFELRSVEPPGPRESEFLSILERQHLAPEGTELRWQAIRESTR